MVGRLSRRYGWCGLKGDRDVPVSCTVDLVGGGTVNEFMITNHRIHWIESTGLPSRIKGVLWCLNAPCLKVVDTIPVICGYRLVLKSL
jgi:hypothetical protein